MKYQEKTGNKDTERPLKRLLDCYTETGAGHQVLSPCKVDDDVDDFEVQVTVHRDKFL